MWLKFKLIWFIMFVAWAITFEKVVYDGNRPADGIGLFHGTPVMVCMH